MKMQVNKRAPLKTRCFDLVHIINTKVLEISGQTKRRIGAAAVGSKRANREFDGSLNVSITRWLVYA